MRRPTLDEKNFGPGFRDRLVTHGVRVFHDCAIPTCGDGVYAVVRLYVDAHPPGMDWYTRLVRSIPLGEETDVGLCQGHAADVVARDLEFMDNPDLWEPGRENPPVMPGPSISLRD
jgi:hypothetical protein